MVEPFARKFPERFLNVGVAEQNLTGIAAGIAVTGKIVFTYSIANFPILRCFEQIRNDVCYHKANVKIVSVGGGYSYGPLGMTHHATEDIAVLRALPEMAVVAPGDPVEVRGATRAIAAHEGPCYLRLGRAGEPTIHDSAVKFQLGKAIQVRDGDAITIISTGALLQNAVQAADKLAARGIHARVLSMHTVKPLDEDAILAAARRNPSHRDPGRAQHHWRFRWSGRRMLGRIRHFGAVQENRTSIRFFLPHWEPGIPSLSVQPFAGWHSECVRSSLGRPPGLASLHN